MKFLRLLVAVTAVFAVGIAHGETFPVRPVKIVVPFPPGGGNDVFARIIGQKLAEAWKREVIVENRAGAGGNIGTAAVASAPHDGYTLLLGHTGTLAINPALYPKLAFDVQKDLAPIGLFASAPLVLVVNPATPASSVAALVDLAKTHPGKVNYASSGSGTGAHLTGELFAEMAKVSIVHVPYKGTAPAITDLLGGQVQMMFSVIPTALPHVQAGKLRALAVTSAKRIGILPNVPTVAESGLPGFESVLSYGLLAPAKTPEPIIREIHAQIGRALASPEVRERLAGEGAEPATATPAEFGALIRRETEKWGRVVRRSGAKVD